MKVLILTANYGNGHYAIAKQLKKQYIEKDYEVIMVNPHYLKRKYIAKLIELNYENIAKNSRKRVVKDSYGIMFELFANKLGDHITKFGRSAIKDLIKTESPDLIIFTFPFNIKLENVKTQMVVTDYGFSKVWLNTSIDNYIVGSNEVYDGLLKYIPSSKISLSGIPCSSIMHYQRKAHNINSVLINLGAFGIGNINKLLKLINSLLEKKLKVTVICGRNKKIYTKLSEIYEFNESIIIQSFTKEIHLLYKTHDLLVTKAGGITISEAINAEIPMVINQTDSLTGQEELNVQFIQNSNLGLISNYKNISKVILQLYKENNSNGNKEYIQMVNNLKNLKQKYNQNK